MVYIQTLLKALASIVILFFLAKLIGNRQIAQMGLFDYISGITIGSIASEMCFADGDEIINAMIALTVYGLVTVCIAIVSQKSLRLRTLFTGRASILYDEGKFLVDNMNNARVDVHELLALARNQGYFDMSDVQTIIFEFNGALSILPKSTSRYLTPEDMSINPAQDKVVNNIVVNGKIMRQTLENVGKSEEWVLSSIRALGYGDIKQLMLVTLDNKGVLSIYPERKTK